MPPPPPDEGEDEEDDGGPALKFAFTPAGATVMQPVAAPVTPLQEGDDDDDVQPLQPQRSKTSLLKRRAKPIALTTAPLESDDDEDDDVAVPSLREEDAVSEGPAAVPPFRVGDEVEARWNYQEGGLTWYLGRIAAVHRDGSCDVAYDDRDFEERVAPNLNSDAVQCRDAGERL